MPAKLEFDLNSFFGDVTDDLQSYLNPNNANYTILDFLDQDVDKEAWGIELNERQMTVLKTFYGLALNEREIQILDGWKNLDRTSFDIQDDPSPKNALCVEAGRRGGKCVSLETLMNIGSSGLVYAYEVLDLRNQIPLSFPKSNDMSINRNSLPTTAGAVALQTLTDLTQATGKNTFKINEIVALEGKDKTARATSFFVKGHTPTKVVATHCGYLIEGTPEHRIKYLNKEGEIVWRYLGEAQEGDRVCIHRATNLFPSEEQSTAPYVQKALLLAGTNTKLDCKLPETLNEAWGYLLGLLVANGSWTLGNTVECTFHSQDEANYREAFEKTLPVHTVSYDPRSKFGARIRCFRKLARDFLHFVGFNQEAKTTDKKTPHLIRKSPKHVVAAYLSGLFDGDGSVDSAGKGITFCTASKQLSIETQLLLLNFGIVCYRKEKTVKGKPYYCLLLRGQRSKKIFATEIGFRLERKQKLVLNNLQRVCRDGGDTEKIPNQGVWLRRLRDCLPNNTGKQPGSHHAAGKIIDTDYTAGKPKLVNLRLELRNITGNSIKEGTTEEFSAYRLPALLAFARQHCQADKEAIQHFEYLQDCDYFYDEIKEVTDSQAFCVDLTVPGHEQYVAQGFTNHNTALASVIVGYEFTRLCKMASPQKYYGIAANTLISIFCIATAAAQSKRTIFGQAKGFLDYIPYIKNLVAKGRIVIGEEEVKYPEKRLYIYSGNSKSASQVGSAVIVMVLDEVARFQNKDGESNAMELWSNIGASGATFGNEAKQIAISSAWAEGDAIQKLYNQSKLLKNWVGFRFRTWDLNPMVSRETPVVASSYALNLQEALLEYEGVRYSNLNTFFPEHEVQRAFQGRCSIRVHQAVQQEDKLIRLVLKSMESASYGSYMHLDPALKRDAFAMAVGHRQEDGGVVKVVIDGLMVWIPDVDTQVSISNVYDMIYKVHGNRRLLKVTSDQHMPEIIQRLRQHGLSAETVALSNRSQNQMYDATRKLLHEDRLILPKDSPWTARLQEEMISIELISTAGGTSTRVQHRPDGSKDIIDCVVGVVWQALGSQYQSANPIVTRTAVRNHSTDYFAGSEEAQDDAFNSWKPRSNVWKQQRSSRFSEVDEPIVPKVATLASFPSEYH